jgi:hypothetical protein
MNLGEPVQLKPSKVERHLRDDDTLNWMHDPIDLATHAIVGPFDFVLVRKPLRGKGCKAARPESHRIDNDQWRSLRTRGPAMGVDISNLDRIVNT